MDKIEPERLKKFLLDWLTALRNVETEAHVYRYVTEALRTISPDLVKQVEEASRLKVVGSLDKKYAQHEKLLLESLDTASWDQVLSQYLQDWKPDGPIN
jgi:hypothetical protein